MQIETSHVGSLPRSKKVVDFIFAKEKEQAYDEIAFDETMKEAVELTVKKQKDAGITIASDGETSKISYATYVKDRFHGFGGDSPRNAPADLKLFPTYLEKLANDGGTPKYARPMCIDKLKSKNSNDLDKDISKASVCSAVALVLPPGVFNTIIFFSFAAIKSILSFVINARVS